MRNHTLALVIVTAAACGTTTRFAATNPSPRPLVPRPAEQVAVFTLGAPAEGFVEVGIIEAHQSSGFSGDKMPEIIAEMRRTAGERGCDALVVNGPRDHARGGVATTQGSFTAISGVTLEGFWGACLVVDANPRIARH